jgi:hypothetical protein
MKLRVAAVMLVVATLFADLDMRQGRYAQAQVGDMGTSLQANDALAVVVQVGGSVTAVAA